MEEEGARISGGLKLPLARLAAWGMVPALACAIACGGRADNPTAPPQPQPEQNGTSLHLDSGQYLLGIELSTSGAVRCENGLCVGLTLCLAGSTRARADVAVIVDRQQDEITVRALDRPATFRMALRAIGAGVSGTASGAATAADGLPVSVGGSSGGAAVVGTAAVAGALEGTLDGALSIGTSNCSNNGHAWKLAKR